jgi:hypothetical protein
VESSNAPVGGGSSSTTSGLGESTAGCSASSLLYPPTNVQASPVTTTIPTVNIGTRQQQHLLPHLQPQRFQQVRLARRYKRPPERGQNILKLKWKRPASQNMARKPENSGLTSLSLSLNLKALLLD